MMEERERPRPRVKRPADRIDGKAIKASMEERLKRPPDKIAVQLCGNSTGGS